ncbi:MULTISPECIES: SdiA-regulated domain-containing protein [unclassified Pseudomonas]|uniref:SdiA-regulated domain-containing protein n=1 Tax=unclassified Pseudomonas TaxID=196821 RepID=UPI000D336D53|nr:MULTISPECIES: SdiA-regulated domain-containing protein [unclassified Pseudomonas]RAU46555.1 DNA-binding protein [Pseudomonas sp. RIT 409]RAU52432.1 DNA-binding protein [Pseudomonas sp. RIT 412]
MSFDTQSLTPPARLLRFRGAWLLIALVVILAELSYVWHWDARGLLWLREQTASAAQRNASIWLPDYRVVIDGKPLAGLEKDEASDLSYDASTKTLYSVMGKNPFLVQLSLTGDVLRKIPLIGWGNPEGVAVLGNGLIAIVDEREHMLSMVTVSPDTDKLNINDFPKYDLGPSADQNKAFEGVAWDARNQRLLLGEERPPALFSWKSDGSAMLKGDKQRWVNDNLIMRNLSALHVDQKTGHLVALSAESHLLLELDDQGDAVSFMALVRGLNGLDHTIPRAEGVTMDDDGTLYVVSEPNLFYSFKKK